MNKDQARGNWEQLKGKAKRVWGEPEHAPQFTHT